MLLPKPAIVVPTDDATVISQLRELDQPKTYFGEGPAERRDRLKDALTKLDPGSREKIQNVQAVKSEVSHETFYYEGCDALKKARYQIADYSVKQSNYRLDMARIKQLEPVSTRLVPQHELIEKIRTIEDAGSYIDEDISTTELKTLTSCSFNQSATLMATSCRSGKCKIWSIPDMDTRMVYRGHQSMTSFITFSPNSGIDLPPGAANLASCSMNGSLNLWSLIDDSPITQLSGPQRWRITRVRYHPCGYYLASCCSDKSWRLWDIKTQSEILHQEGHADDVFDLGFHPDGSLAGSASMDSYARIWDLRTGRSILTLEGHSKGLRTIDFSPDGYHVATGSLDNTVKIWNLRKRNIEYTIPAHTNTITTVMFEKENGYYLVTGSFDKTIKFWSSRTWAPIKTLEAFEDRVTRFDISRNSQHLVSCYSKYVKLFSVET